ncbi:hypothetical protein B0F90DRAFT_1654815 [Multifurca ochricompacta]|uniref:Sister chromatid cohesion protein n=1 Tax=Multifurca ochricompacta TaxID=376703 RepID=A0AAD4QIW6_9AGAM|nr:hypothetical protein B0F90DRAFT_1654815 [Multifurca ochricompacta]
MQDSSSWYSRQSPDAGQHVYPMHDPVSSTSAASPEAVHDPQSLPAVYPFASATPTTHVTRHLSHLSVGASAPYEHPHYYNANGYHYPSSNPPPYTEYATEPSRLQAVRYPGGGSDYWAGVADDTSRYLGSHHYPEYHHHMQYAPYHTYPSYPTNSLSQSVFQSTVSSFSSPTPPPPGIHSSSSSLAFALDERAVPPKKQYPQQDSAAFFTTFLNKSSRELERAQAAKYTNPPSPSRRDRSFSIPRYSSPDPLEFPPSPSITPQKRKSIELLQSRSVKRVQTLHRTSSSPLSGPPTTPASSSQGSLSIQGTPLSSQAQVTPSSRPVAAHKPKMRAYIELPPAPKFPSIQHPSNSARKSKVKAPLVSHEAPQKTETDEEDDLGGFGPEEDRHHHPRKTSLSMTETGRFSAKRTGDRDDRAPLEKLITLLEDIFEAEDTLPADADQQSLPADFFSPLTVEPSQPQLHPNLIRKLSKLISQVARPIKRLRSSTATTHTPRPLGPCSISDVETTTLSRILKVLERSVRAGEDLDPFKTDRPPEVRPSASPNKKSKVSKKPAIDQGSQSQAPLGDDEPQSVARTAEPPQVTDTDLDLLAHTLEVARDSILAADCCIALLGADRLPKQVYSEELIMACLGAVKNQLERIVYPFVESLDTCALLQHVSKHEKMHRAQIAEVFQVLASVLPRINNLVCADTVAMSDSIIIQGVYIAIGPFFVTEAGASDIKGKKESFVLNTLGQTAMRGLRLEALSLIRSVFANHEDQRSWIIEEILSSLIKLSDTKQKAGQFRLRDGRSIRTVSALLLQLVQTSAHGVRVQAKRLAKARQQALAMRRQESTAETPSEKPPGPFLDERDNEEIQLYMSGLESATKAAKTIVLFLTQRSGRAKATKNSNEAEYRAIFDNLVSDLLVVLFWPEWPAASLLLGIICKFMILISMHPCQVSSLDDVKSTSQTDNNAAKTMALDHLGVIAARIRSSMLKTKQGADGDGFLGLKPLDEILPCASIKHLERLASAHQDLATHLAKRSAQEQAYESARELTAVTWGQELAIALGHCDTSLRYCDDSLQDQQPSLLPFGRKVKSALRDVWKEVATDIFDIGSPEEVARIDRLAEEIGIVQDLRSSYQPILNVTLLALDAPPVFVRTKALRALGQIVTSDPTILTSANVRRGIESHLLDSSPAVRDAAVELIGKYVIESPEVAGDYYQKIADRIADTGLGVRKRVIKLLRALYSVGDDIKRRTDICTRLVLRMFDEDDTVKDLSIKTLEELWFPNIVSQPALQKLRNGGQVPDQQDKAQLLNKVSVIMSVAANFRDRQSPLEDVLHKIMVSKEDNEASQLHARYGEICEALIDGLVDASELPGFTVINCIRTIYLFSSAYPAIVSGSNASTLLPYLKNATSSEEQVTSDYLLKIFRVSVPHMPKTAVKFGNELQQALQPMVLKPSTAGGVQALQETVACLCAVVQHLTHDFNRLVGLLKSCNTRLQAAAQKTQMAPADLRTLSILIFIISLLVGHCNFDCLRTDHPDLSADLDMVSKGSIIEHVYSSLLGLYQKHSEPGLRGRTLQCLGFLFRAQPTLMTLESSAMIMDATFASQEEEGRARLLRIMQEFLVSEATKHAHKEKNKASAKGKQAPTEVNMEELVGNTDGFADSGVSSAIVQRYMDPILDAALSQHPQIQGAAVDILSFTIKQGLAHPLQSFPVIVALETSPNTTLSTRASALHSVLHIKHASLLNSRYIMSARASFSYQTKLVQGREGSGVVQGARGGTALLHRWFALVREKRGPKLDFLKALVRAFDMGTALAVPQEDVDFARYMAENFATFDYKTQEEVLLVIKSLTNVLSTAGMQCVEALSPGHLLAQLLAANGPQPPLAHANGADAQLTDAMSMAVPSGEGGEGGLALQSSWVPGSTHTSMDTVVMATVTPLWQTLEKLPLLRSSVLIALIMLLKAHLKNLYGLSEEKCLKWVIGKKNALGDKPATRRAGAAAAPLTWARLPFATRPLLTTADMAAQRDTFLKIWNEDGVTADPEDDFA